MSNAKIFLNFWVPLLLLDTNTINLLFARVLLLGDVLYVLVNYLKKYILDIDLMLPWVRTFKLVLRFTAAIMLSWFRSESDRFNTGTDIRAVGQKAANGSDYFTPTWLA